MQLVDRTLPRLVALGLALSLAPAAAAQATLYVDDDGPGDPFPGFSDPLNSTFSDPLEDGSSAHPFDDLWKAVAVAQPGDEVLVLPSNVVGAYFLSDTLDLQGKAITLRSQAGPAVTALDGTSMPGAPGILMTSGETSSTLVEGFTLRNFDHGSAVGDDGGGMEIRNGSPLVRDCWFQNNHAYVGGGLYANDASPTVEDCRFIGNAAVHQGGGAYNFTDSSPTYRRCRFEGNSANYAAGYMCWSSSGRLVLFEDCTFFQNTADVGYAGGLAKFESGKLEVRRTRFVDNQANTLGGGVYLSGDSLVSDCLFNANASLSGQGGGLSAGPAGTHFVRGTTIHGNAGGGVHENGNPVFLTLQNCIVWSNGTYELTSQVGVSTSDVLGGYAGSNIDADPLFNDADGPDNIPGNLDDDFTLFHLSPCIDAGDSSVIPAGYPRDLARARRAVPTPHVPDTGVAALGIVTDMGAFEFQPTLQRQRVR